MVMVMVVIFGGVVVVMMVAVGWVVGRRAMGANC
jgi:hypothetical protein